MDLRVKRTIKSIKEAFFELRKKKPLDKISVKELSELAMINKATFYLHYRDIYELSDTLENEIINRIINETRTLRFINLKSDFPSFAETVSKAIIANSNEIQILFSGFENNHFINHLEDSIKKYIFSSYPTVRNNTENNLLFTFIIQGAFHTYVRNTSVRTDVLVDKTTSMMTGLMNSYSF